MVARAARGAAVMGFAARGAAVMGFAARGAGREPPAGIS